MKLIARIGWLSLLLLLAAGAAAAATVTGNVRNGTSGTPAAGVDIILIQLQGDMQAVANTKTDAQGNYTLDSPLIGQGPMLIRAVYRGVNFHQPLVPGNNAVNVTIYEPSNDPKLLTVATRVIVFQPNNASLLVGEEYGLQNLSAPPQAFYDQQGSFGFELPEGSQLSQVSTWGPSKMPVVQGPINKGDRQYAVAYAFQPGENGVRLSYDVPYPSNQARLRLTSRYAAERVLLVAPPSVKIESAGFAPSGSEQGFNLYARERMPAGVPFEVSVSGTAPPPAPSQTGTDPGQDQLNGRDSNVAIQAMPNRLDSLKWVLIGGFAALFGLGMFFIWRRPVAVLSDGGAGVAIPSSRTAASRAARKPAAPAPAEPRGTDTAPSGATNSQSAAAVEVEVERSLDALKDKLFRLELRHQAGTISEEEYSRERGRTEQILRELLRG